MERVRVEGKPFRGDDPQRHGTLPLSPWLALAAVPSFARFLLNGSCTFRQAKVTVVGLYPRYVAGDDVL